MQEQDLSLLDAITIAKERELKAAHIYQDAALKTNNAKGIELFNALAGFERKHLEALIEMEDALRSREVFRGYKVMAIPSQGWTFDDSTVDPNSLELIEIIDLALENEDIAEKGYLELAEQSTGKDVRELFTKLAAEERFHTHLLKSARTSLKLSGNWAFSLDSLPNFL